MKTRTEALRDLLQAQEPLTVTLRILNQYSWDSVIPLITLTRAHIVQALKRYIAGAWTSEDIEAWANAIEGREDIGYESSYEAVLTDCIYQMANPLLVGAMTTNSANAMLGELN